MRKAGWNDRRESRREKGNGRKQQSADGNERRKRAVRGKGSQYALETQKQDSETPSTQRRGILRGHTSLTRPPSGRIASDPSCDPLQKRWHNKGNNTARQSPHKIAFGKLFIVKHLETRDAFRRQNKRYGRELTINDKHGDDRPLKHADPAARTKALIVVFAAAPFAPLPSNTNPMQKKPHEDSGGLPHHQQHQRHRKSRALKRLAHKSHA